MSEITGEIENIDKLFSEININGETHQSENYVEKAIPVYQPAPEPQEGASFEPSPSVIGQDVTGIDLNSILHPIKDENISQQVETLNQAMQAIQQRMTELNALIPSQASASNKLADKAFVNSSVQTATANFRGNWNDFSSVPTDVSLYPVDYAGSKTPTVNDYLVVQDASDYTEDTLEGTWRFKYSGTWSVEGKNGWRPEYQVNETPLTQAQLEALNSGITAQAVENMAVIDDTTTSDTTVYSSEKTQNELDIRTSEYIATSSTSASTQIKVVTMTTYEGNTIPSNCELSVTFTYGNTASNPKLQVKNKNDVVIGTFDICDSRGHNADTGCWNNGDLMIFKTVGNKALITNSDVRSSTSSYIIYADGTRAYPSSVIDNKIPTDYLRRKTSMTVGPGQRGTINLANFLPKNPNTIAFITDSFENNGYGGLWKVQYSAAYANQWSITQILASSNGGSLSWNGDIMTFSVASGYGNHFIALHGY